MSGKWYVIHTLSGCENKVRASLEGNIGSESLGDSIFRVLVPTEEVAEIRG